MSEDRRPNIAICNWSPTDPVWDLVEDLSGVPWHPDHARSELIEGDPDVKGLAGRLAHSLNTQDARALLLIGQTRHEGPARLQIRAEMPKTDGHRMDSESPGIVRATAPSASILQAVAKARVAIVASSDDEEDTGSELLYRVMISLADTPETPAVAMLRFPPSMGEASISAAIKAAANVMTQHLSPLRASSVR